MDNIYAINVKSYFLMSKAVLPNMMERKSGHIINMSSIQSIASQRCVVAYVSSKGAVTGLSRALALDYGKYNIRVNSVSPGKFYL